MEKNQKKIASLCIVRDLSDNTFLMVENHRGINAGYLNFPGGKQEIGENIVQCAIRETYEETGLTIKNPVEVGYLEFPTKDFYVFVFMSTEFSGTMRYNPSETRAFWQDGNEIPYDKMRDDVRDLLPDILAGKYVKRRYILDDDFHILEIVDL